MPSEKYIIFANETTPRSSHESPCASARGQTRIPMTSISSNTQTHGFQCLESFFPQALIHPASKKEVVYSETKRRRARTKRQARTHIRKAAKVEKALSYKLWRSCPRERGSDGLLNRLWMNILHRPALNSDCIHFESTLKNQLTVYTDEGADQNPQLTVQIQQITVDFPWLTVDSP